MKIFTAPFSMTISIGLAIFLASCSTLQGQLIASDEATAVVPGQTTDKEREYSKEYRKVYPNDWNRRLSDLVQLVRERGLSGKEVGTAIGIPTVPDLGQYRETGLEFLSKLVCKSDAIVVGSFQIKSAHLTDDEKFIYTGYDLSVSNILKNTTDGSISLQKTIEVTRPGGRINLDGQIVRVEDRSYSPLQKGQDYLLFLRFVPSAGGFMVADVKGDFVQDGDKFRSLSRLGIPSELRGDLDYKETLGKVDAAVAAGCKTP